MATAAGVSMSTVSNVLNKPAVVTLDTRRRVEAAMATIGYVRNGAARQLRGAPAITVGCVVLDSANPFFAEIGRGMQDRLTEAGCMLVVCSTDVQSERETGYLDMLEELGVRGILLSPESARLDAAAAVSRRGTPVVLVDHTGPGTVLCAVTVDDVRGGELAVEHLLELGHRRIALLEPEADVPSVLRRVSGVCRAVTSAGLSLSAALMRVPLAPPASVNDAQAAMTDVLAARPRPTAVVCFNDMAAIGVMRGLRLAGVTVPGQMSVVGYDDVVFASELSPPLTTIRQPTYRVGWAAAELLLTEGLAGHRHREVRFIPDLVVRGSTAPAYR